MKISYSKRLKRNLKVRRHQLKSFLRRDISISCVYGASSGYKNIEFFRINIKESLKNERIFYDGVNITYAKKLLETIKLIETHLYETHLRKEYHNMNPLRVLERLRRFLNWVPLSIIIEDEKLYRFKIRESSLPRIKNQVEDIVKKYENQKKEREYE